MQRPKRNSPFRTVRSVLHGPYLWVHPHISASPMMPQLQLEEFCNFQTFVRHFTPTDMAKLTIELLPFFPIIFSSFPSGFIAVSTSTVVCRVYFHAYRWSVCLDREPSFVDKRSEWKRGKAWYVSWSVFGSLEYILMAFFRWQNHKRIWVRNHLHVRLRAFGLYNEEKLTT